MIDFNQLLDAIDISAIRAQGSGGQNVNKVSSAIHLRFRILDSVLADDIKQRLLTSADSRVTRNGEIIIKSQNNRTQELNKQAAFERLKVMIEVAAIKPKIRKPTRPTKASKRRRLDSKKKEGQKKALRGKPIV